MINIIDIIQGKFIQEFSAISMGDVLVSITLSFLLSLFIVFIYRSTYAGVNFSSSFAGCLMMISMVTTLVILVISSNVVLSLGMVGALSIVRFRTAIKEPLDIAFLFWAIAGGIVLAAGMIPLAIVGSVVIGIVLLVFVNKKSHVNPYIVVLRCDSQKSEQAACAFLDNNVQRCTVKSKSVEAGLIELNLEVRLKGEDTTFVNALAKMTGVQSAVLVSYNGDYMG